MKKIISIFQSTINRYNLIQNGDKIAIGISGGKDSITLLDLANKYSKFSKNNFTIVAIMIDMFNGNTNTKELELFCNENNIKFHKVATKAYDIIFNIKKETNPCSLCSKMRNGALNSKAKELNCNKVAIGHHLDDFIETFFLSLVYENRLSTFKPKSFLDRKEITTIRPLMDIKESQITTYQNQHNLPIIENKCPIDKKTKRETVKNQISNLEKTFPNIKDSIHSALTNPKRYNLFQIEKTK